MKKMLPILRCIYLSFHKSDIKTRSVFSLNEEETKALYEQLKDVFNVSEAFIISTCNRTEIYFYNEEDLSDKIIDYLSTLKSPGKKDAFSKTSSHQESVERLFTVGIGLDSQILGDQQVIHQFKKAYQMACDTNAAGIVLHKLLHSLFHTNKRVVNETQFSTGQASIAYVTALLINSFQLSNPKVLVIGVGEFGKEVAKNIKANSEAQITLTNRSAEKAEELAEQVGGTTIDFQDIHKKISRFDVVINCAHKENIISTKTVLAYKKLTYTYFIDLSIPCGIDRNIESVSGNIYYNLDDLKDISDRSLEERRNAVPEVKAIIKEEIKALEKWHQTSSFNPVLTMVKDTLEEIRKKAIGSQLQSLDSNNFKLVNEITLKFMNELIKIPALDLQQRCLRGEDTDERIKIITEIFSATEKNLSKIKN